MAEPFRVGVVPGVTPDRWIRIWRERMPAVPLAVVALPEGDAIGALGGDVDVVFARLPIDAPGLHVIPLWEESPVVVAGRDHPLKVFDAVTLADLADEDVRPGAEEALLDLVAAGHALATMPQSVFRATGRRDLVARPITDAPPTRVALAWRTEPVPPWIDDFIGIVRGRTANSSRGTETPSATTTRSRAATPPKRSRRPAPPPAHRRRRGR